MLGWMCGITNLDRIRKEIIRGTTNVIEISKKVHERVLNCGHVMRREEGYVNGGDIFAGKEK